MPLSAFLCNKCKKYTCVGCRQKLALGSKAITILKSPEVTISNCCENGKIFGIWVLLSAFDESELLFQKQTIESTPSSYHHQPLSKALELGTLVVELLLTVTRCGIHTQHQIYHFHNLLVMMKCRTKLRQMSCRCCFHFYHLRIRSQFLS